MISLDALKLCRLTITSILVLAVLVAGLATAVAAPAGATTAHMVVAQPNEWQINESDWHIDDTPALHGQSWWGGEPANGTNSYGQPYGYGPARHNGSSYAYVSEETGNPGGHWARWDMGTRRGTQEIAVFVPRADASARVNYRITIGSSTTRSDWITQREIYGWHSLGTVSANDNRVRIEVHYDDSQHAPGQSGASARRLGVDAVAMRCVSNCSSSSATVPGRPSVELNVQHESDGSRTVVATWSPPAEDGGSAITGYEVTFSRPGRTFATRNRSSSARRHTLSGAWSNTRYTFTIRAKNSVGEGPEVSSSIRTSGVTRDLVPGLPRNVRLTVVGQSDGSRTVVATWSPPAEDGGSAITGYEVTFSRPGRTFATRNRSSSARRHTLSGAWSNTRYTFTIRAKNSVGEGPEVSSSIRTSGVTRDLVPGLPRNVRLTVVGQSDGSRTVVATWSPPAEDGGSAITGYEVTFSRPGRTFATRNRSSSARRHTLPGAWSNTTYTFTIRAKNSVGVSAAVDTSKATSERSDGCPSSGKYLAARDGRWPSPHRVTSQRQFETTDGRSVNANVKGGIVSSGIDDGTSQNLSQSGCSWISYNARVVDSALVSQNALITGTARVEDSARVYGNAIVSGDARVRDQAQVYGQARVTDRAEVSGSALVYGDAQIIGTMKIDSGKFDGKQEFERVARDIERLLRADLTSRHRECFNDEDFIRRQVDNLMDPPSREWYNVAVATYNACRQLELLRTIMRDFAPTAPELFFGYAAGIVGALKLPLYARSLLTIIEGVENMRQIKRAGDSMSKIIEDLEEAYEAN